MIVARSPLRIRVSRSNARVLVFILFSVTRTRDDGAAGSG
jgi:hypothetical protein